MSDWTTVCEVDAVVPGTGVCALVSGRQVAVFRLEDERLFAIDNFDPNSGANVLSRGIVGDLGGEPVVASPIYKQHFRLGDGVCIEDEGQSVVAHEARVLDGRIIVRLEQADGVAHAA